MTDVRKTEEALDYAALDRPDEGTIDVQGHELSNDRDLSHQI